MEVFSTNHKARHPHCVRIKTIVYIFSELPQLITQEQRVKNNYMFRLCYRAIVKLYRNTGDYVIGIGYYLGDEISSYIVVLGVKAGYRHIYMCVCVYVSVICDMCIFNV